MGKVEAGRYYDIISDPAKRLAHEGDFLLWLLEKAPGPRVLDMACGTGVQALFLAEHGARLTARDVDADMISYARSARPHERIAYEVADMRGPAGGTFDLAVVMGNSISMLPTSDDVAATLGRIGEMLSPGGVAFVHVINYSLLSRKGPQQKVARGNSSGDSVVIVKDMVPAGDSGALVSFSYFQKTAGEWKASGQQGVLLDLRREFLRKAAAPAGLILEGEYGDYDRSEFDENRSPDLLLVFGKARR